MPFKVFLQYRLRRRLCFHNAVAERRIRSIRKHTYVTNMRIDLPFYLLFCRATVTYLCDCVRNSYLHSPLKCRSIHVIVI